MPLLPQHDWAYLFLCEDRIAGVMQSIAKAGVSLNLDFSDKAFFGAHRKSKRQAV